MTLPMSSDTRPSKRYIYFPNSSSGRHKVTPRVWTSVIHSSYKYVSILKHFYIKFKIVVVPKTNAKIMVQIETSNCTLRVSHGSVYVKNF